MPESAGRPQVAVVQRALRRYRQPFFDELRRQLDDVGIDLRVLYSVYRNPPANHEERGDSATLSWAQPVPSWVWPPKTNKLVWQPALGHLRDVDLVVVEQASGALLNYVLFAHQAIGRARVALWGHGRNFDSAQRSRGGEVLKRWLSTRPHWWFAYTDEAAGVVADLGFPRDRITVVQNATDSRALADRVDGFDDQRLEEHARRHGITGSNVGLFLGSLVGRRRIEFLLAAADDVRRAVPDFELIVAGGGRLASTVEEAARTRPWLRSVGPVFGDDLAAWLRTAKVAMVPGWVGLSVVDCFAGGLPMVTSDSGAHGHPPEFGYIVDGHNGRVVSDGGNPAVYADAVTRLLIDEPTRKTLVQGCLESRERYTVEAMAQRFREGIQAALRR